MCFIFMNREGAFRGVKVKGSRGYSDHEMLEFKILRGGITTMDFRRAVFGLFKDLLRKISLETILEKKEVQGKPNL